MSLGIFFGGEGLFVGSNMFKRGFQCKEEVVFFFFLNVFWMVCSMKHDETMFLLMHF